MMLCVVRMEDNCDNTDKFSLQTYNFDTESAYSLWQIEHLSLLYSFICIVFRLDEDIAKIMLFAHTSKHCGK